MALAEMAGRCLAQGDPGITHQDPFFKIRLFNKTKKCKSLFTFSSNRRHNRTGLAQRMWSH